MPVYENPLNLTLLGNEPIAVLPSRILGIGETVEPGAGQGSATEIMMEKSEARVTVREDYTTVLNLLRAEEFMQLTGYHGGRRIALAIRWVNYIQSVEKPGGSEHLAQVYAGDQSFMTAEDYSAVLAMYKIIDPFKWAEWAFSVAAYAGMYEDNIGFASLDLDWTPLDGYSNEDITPRGITTDLAAGTMTFHYEGVYQIAFAINLSHNESNQGRTTNVRFYNVTDGQPEGAAIEIGIGRNQPATNFFITFLVPVTAAMKNKAFRLEMGGGSSITGIGGDFSYDANMISEWQDPDTGIGPST